jgi:hypothetical protein
MYGIDDEENDGDELKRVSVDEALTIAKPNGFSVKDKWRSFEALPFEWGDL